MGEDGYVIKKIKTSQSKPDHETLTKIANCFNVTTNDLLERTDDPKVTEQDKKHT